MIPNINFTDRFGYYKVGGTKTFLNKIDACIEATKTKSWIEWIFNKEVLDRFDWITPPNIGLKEIYRRRAQQLREKYDYIVLNYSGGGDSHNVLRSFLDNNIRLDEILVRWPRKRTEKIYTPSSFSSADNHMSEWDLTLLPDIQWIKQHHPNIHVEFYDYSDDALDYFKTSAADNDPWFNKGLGSQLSPGHVVRWRTSIDRYQRMFKDKGLRGCQLYGIDKPRVCYKDGDFFVFYLDSIASAVVHLDDYDDVFSAVELFYWTPDMPDVVKVQAHTLMQFFVKNTNLLPVIAPHASKSYTLRNTYETIVRSIIYPNWDFNRFQASKPSSLFWCEMDNWIYNEANADNQVIGAWKHSIDYVESNIEEKYIMRDQFGKSDGLVGMITPFYKIGSMPQ